MSSERSGRDSNEASTSPSDAFQALADDVRVAVLRALDADGPLSFSALHAESGVETSAGFAYHLRQLDGLYVRQGDDDRYELTAAGRDAIRTVCAGTYTDSVERDPIELAEACPFCAETALVATVSDNVTEVACEGCSSPILGLSLPPSAYADRDPEALPDALDAYHRRRIASFDDGVCPDCGGAVGASVEPVTDTDEDDPSRVQAAFDCEGCGASLRCPVALTVLDHPAVVSFYHDHCVDLSDRPLWNVGSEWSERLLSESPWCLAVSARLDDERLSLYVARDGTIAEHRRRPIERDGEASPESDRSVDDGATA